MCVCVLFVFMCGFVCCPFSFLLFISRSCEFATSCIMLHFGEGNKTGLSLNFTTTVVTISFNDNCVP